MPWVFNASFRDWEIWRQSPGCCMLSFENCKQQVLGNELISHAQQHSGLTVLWNINPMFWQYDLWKCTDYYCANMIPSLSVGIKLKLQFEVNRTLLCFSYQASLELKPITPQFSSTRPQKLATNTPHLYHPTTRPKPHRDYRLGQLKIEERYKAKKIIIR
jgi:hypothetical protein